MNIQRSSVKTRICFLRGRTAKQCHRGLLEAYGAAALLFKTSAGWVAAFGDGRERVEHMTRSVHPPVINENLRWCPQLTLILQLTHDVEVEAVALAIAFRVVAHASVVARTCSAHALKHQTLIADDDTTANVLQMQLCFHRVGGLPIGREVYGSKVIASFGRLLLSLILLTWSFHLVMFVILHMLLISSLEPPKILASVL
ncbi:hypothetical protein C0J52_03816 [Blattella germanica]|nr:hypothetical protein C0J52_03816 [Blattella germanica]